MRTAIQGKSQSQIQVRIDAETKKEAKKVLEEIGLDASSAVKILFKQIVLTQSFPIALRTGNGFTFEQERTMTQETKEAIKRGKRYSSIKDAHKDILK